MPSLAKAIASRVLQSALTPLCLNVIERCSSEPSDLLRVLTYHRISDPIQSCQDYPGAISADVDQFSRQMEYVANHCQAISLERLSWHRQTQSPLPKRSVLITFDDAYRDFQDLALPVLAKHQLPSVLFVPTAFPGASSRAFWRDRLYRAVMGADADMEIRFDEECVRLGCESARQQIFCRLRDQVKRLEHGKAMQLVDDVCEQLKAQPAPNLVLDWDQLRSLPSQGVAIGTHSHRHPLMNRITQAEALEEIRTSARHIESQLGEPATAFAFPNGSHNTDVSGLLEGEGFEFGFTTCRGVNHLKRDDPFRLRRINVGRRTDATPIRIQMTPQFRYLDAIWR